MDASVQQVIDWVYLKLLIWKLNLSLTKEQRAENKAALKDWEAHRANHR